MLSPVCTAKPRAEPEPARWQFATPLESPSSLGYMWHFEALTICSKCFPYLFSLLDSNTGNSSASTKRSFGGQKNSHSHQRAYTHARENLKFIIMGKKEEKKPQHGTSLNNQSQTGKAPEGEKSTDLSKTQEPAMKKKKKQKKTKGDPKTGQEEESHTCCGCRFPLLFALLQLALGISVTVLGFLMAGISSSLLVRDTPYWAGIIVSIKSVSPYSAFANINASCMTLHFKLTNCMHNTI